MPQQVTCNAFLRSLVHPYADDVHAIPYIRMRGTVNWWAGPILPKYYTKVTRRVNYATV